MPDAEVESILREIREQVHADEERNARHRENAVAAINESHSSTASNGQGLLEDRQEAVRIDTQLSTIARAWDRLPPVVSDRRGWAARLELWIKGHAKNAMRWFTWEQVNFNRAVHDALTDVTKILLAEAQELAALRAQLSGEMRREFLTLRSDLGALNNNHADYRANVEARVEKINETLSRISNMLADLTEESRRGSSQLAEQTGALAAALREEQSAAKSQQLEELNRRLSELVTELKEEQRVCFRQLSLEASEAAVLEDRGRRALDARLEKLEESLQTRKG